MNRRCFLGAPRRQCISTEITARRGIAHPAAGSVRQSRVHRHAPLGYLPLWDSVDQPEAAEVIAAMPTKRQTLFRGVWHGMSDVPGINRYYEEANRAV